MPACLEALLIGPLPGVFELGGIERLVVGGVQIVHAGLQAGVHDVQILVGEGHVDHQLRLHLPDQGHQFRHVVGIHLGRLDAVAQLGGNGVALRFGARGEGDLAEDVAPLGAFVGDDLADAAGADDQNFAHSIILPDRYNPTGPVEQFDKVAALLDGDLLGGDTLLQVVPDVLEDLRPLVLDVFQTFPRWRRR